VLRRVKTILKFRFFNPNVFNLCQKGESIHNHAFLSIKDLFTIKKN
jgi:hypothetical protein